MNPTDNLRSLHTAVQKGLKSLVSGDELAIAKALTLRELKMLELRGLLNVLPPLHDLHTRLSQSQPFVSAGWSAQSSSVILRALGMTETEPWRWGLMPERAWLGAKTNEAFDFSLVFPASAETNSLPLVRKACAEAGWAEALTSPFVQETNRIWSLGTGRHSEHPEGPVMTLALVFSQEWERLCQLRAADPTRVVDLSDPALLRHLRECSEETNPWMTQDLRLALDVLQVRDLEGLVLAMAFASHPDELQRFRTPNESSLSCGDSNIERLLQPTRGYLVYQEQFLELCQRLGGWDLVRADRMRRNLGKRAEIGAVEMMTLAQDAVARGWDSRVVKNLTDQMNMMLSLIGILKAHVLPMALQALEVAARTNPGG